MVPDVSAAPDPTVLCYLRSQATLNIGVGLLLALSFAIPVIFRLGKSKLRGLPWIAIGAVAAGACVFYAVRQLRVETPTLTLAGDVLHVGDAALTLDDSTTIDHLGSPDALAIPAPDRKGLRAMPGLWDFPPRFAGGPRVVVKTRAGEVSFQPLVYGPGAYLPSGRPEAAALVAGLLGHGTAGNARDWLRAAFPAPAGPAAEPPSFRRFLTIFLIIAIPVLTMLAVAVGVALKQRLSS